MVYYLFTEMIYNYQTFEIRVLKEQMIFDLEVDIVGAWT